MEFTDEELGIEPTTEETEDEVKEIQKNKDIYAVPKDIWSYFFAERFNIIDVVIVAGLLFIAWIA